MAPQILGRSFCLLLACAAALVTGLLHHVPTDGEPLPEYVRTKRIVLGNQTVPIRPLPVGNLSSPLGDAECHFINNHFYCFSQFTATFTAAGRYCTQQRMKLLSIESEEEHEYLNYFVGQLGINEEFTSRSDFPSTESYTAYVFDNISPGMVVKCVLVCDVRLTDEGRILEYEKKDFIGLAIKVQWKSGRVRWYPAGNLQVGGYVSDAPSRLNLNLPLEVAIFEPGDRVRIKRETSNNREDVWQSVSRNMVGIVADVDYRARSAIVHFPANNGWRGSLSHLEITDKTKAVGSFWTSGKMVGRTWTWTSIDKAFGKFTSWGRNQPGELEGRNPEKCVQIRYHRAATWFVVDCARKSSFICKK